MTSFGPIDRLALFGGSWLSAALCERLQSRPQLQAKLFTSPRHLADKVTADGATLREVLGRLSFPFAVCEEINQAPELREFVTPRTLGLALGAAWVFSKDTVAAFRGALLDFMGIPLPAYRGGAHYTWQILRGNKRGCCNLQLILGGEETFHRGPIVKRREYDHPEAARVPQEFIVAALRQELAFLEEFLDQLARQEPFESVALDETRASYFPFLSTRQQGFIDWSWSAAQIEAFVCAFDAPYDGASTFLGERRVFLRGARADYADGAFHPFMAGLVYRKGPRELFVAARDGALAIREATDESGGDLLGAIQLGQRLHTPQSVLERALRLEASYSAHGLERGEPA